MSTHSSAGTEKDTQTKSSQDTIHPESVYYIQGIFDNWNIVNFVKPKQFINANPTKYTRKLNDEIWIQTTSNEGE